MGTILCFIYDQMAEFEVMLGLFRLAKDGPKTIVTIAHEQRIVTSMCGVQYTPHMTVKEALTLKQVDGLIIPGGENDEQRDELTTLIRRLDTERKLLAAICRAPSYFARAGILSDHPYTTSYSADLAKRLCVADPFQRGNERAANVVRDGHIITAQGEAFVEFAAEILDYFRILKNPEEKQRFITKYRGLA